MKILAAISEPEAIRKILDNLGIPSEAPRRTAARPRGCAAAESELSGTADLEEVDYADPEGGAGRFRGGCALGSKVVASRCGGKAPAVIGLSRPGRALGRTQLRVRA
jgi:hypothetical protein